jgi:hypothetical protein
MDWAAIWGYMIFWPAVAMVCAVVLVAQGASLIRMLFRARQARGWYLLAAIPFAMSIWAFSVGWHAGTIYQFMLSFTGIHDSPMFWWRVMMMIDQANQMCQIVLGATVVVFLAFHLLLMRRKVRGQGPVSMALQIAMMRR